MERRTFMQASVAGLCTATAGEALAADAPAKTGDLFEIRIYSLKPEKMPILDKYLSKAFIPALKKFGIGPVGVFADKSKADALKVYVLIVYSAADQVVTLSSKLAADEEYLKAGEEYLQAPAKDPVYSRIQSSLLSAFEGMPKIEKTDTSKPRLFNLRIYESHNERAGKKKIEMFNKGEIAIFKKVGLNPVLFGEAIIGSALPNLTYLLSFPDDEARKATWEKFKVDPEWVKLSAIPAYANSEIVSNITNLILTPTAYSEI